MEFIDEKGGNPGRAVTEAPTEKVRIDLDQLLKRRDQASRLTLPYLEGCADCALVARDRRDRPDRISTAAKLQPNP